MKAIVTSLFLLFVVQLHAQNDELRKKHFNVKNNIALQGYDPISYFDGAPQEGEEDIKVVHKGITYYFISAAHQNQFKASPEKYEPAFGGWCAYAMGESGEKVKIDPETYKILDGKLYLFYNFWGNNTLTDWNKNEHKLNEDGTRNWAKITH
jgi:YHS domain-containing protein